MAATQTLEPVQEKLVNDKYTDLFESIEGFIFDSRCSLYGRLPFKHCEGYQSLKAYSSEDKIDVLNSLILRVNHYEWPDKDGGGSAVGNRFHINLGLLEALLRTRIDFPRGFSFSGLFCLLYDRTRFVGHGLSRRPIGLLASQIEKHVKKHGVYDQLKSEIGKILQHPIVEPHLKIASSKGGWGPDVAKAIQKLKVIVFDGSANESPPFELGSGVVGKLIESDLKENSDRDQWNTIFHHLATASGSKPKAKFSSLAKEHIAKLGAKKYKALVNRWFVEIAALPVSETVHKADGYDYTYTTHDYIDASLFDLLKGVCWSLSQFHDQETLKNVALLTEKCFQKIPGRGPAAASIGNAGIYMLAQSRGLNGISHLSRLKLRIRQNNTQNLIQKCIDEQAQRLGISAAQVEELAAPDFGLINGVREESFDDYTLRLQLTEVGQTELQWLKPDGKPQKSVPAFVKDNSRHSDKLKKLRDLAKQIKQSSTAQRDRIDRIYTEALNWDLDSFSQYYLNHGLVGQIARKLIWKLDDVPALYYEDQWQDAHGKTIKPKKSAIIALWHPIDSEADEVLQWRDRLYQLEIKQPLKQAYREVYLLTEAEMNTAIYSNRMAGHFLKQHQFNSLASLRGWEYSLLGAYDDGRDGEIASKSMPAHNLTAQYWIDQIIDDGESFNDVGIWHYVATDQIRFCDDSDSAVPLVNIPPLVLSEIMRDADLFVGVASVGNDPAWQDGGPDARPAYREYWASYSFGKLTQVAATRKQVLEKLLPRLKIRDVVRIDGRFLVVDGTKHSYKIHIGSGNVLIAPNDRYLCIVPSRGKDQSLKHIFLPFEGDSGLSIILSKAFLLAADDKITDRTILSQL